MQLVGSILNEEEIQKKNIQELLLKEKKAFGRVSYPNDRAVNLMSSALLLSGHAKCTPK